MRAAALAVDPAAVVFVDDDRVAGGGGPLQFMHQDPTQHAMLGIATDREKIPERAFLGIGEWDAADAEANFREWVLGGER